MSSTMSTFESKYQNAIQLHQGGKYQEARQIYEELAAEQPHNFELIHLLGLVHYDLENHTACESNLQKAIELNPGFAPAYFNLGRLYDKINKFELALQTLEKAVALQQYFPAAHMVIGHAKDYLGDTAGALIAYDMALSQDPRFEDAFTHKGNTLIHANRLEDALVCATKAASLFPNSAGALTNRGAILSDLKRFDEALKSFDSAIQINPKYSKAHLQRGKTLQEMSLYNEALTSVDLALELDPNLEREVEIRIFLTQQISDWKTLTSDIERLKLLVPNSINPMPTFTFLKTTDSRRLQLNSAKTESSKWPTIRTTTALHVNSKSARLNIGYFSSDFRQHPVAQLFNGILECHDPKRFEISAFSFGPLTGDYHQKRTINAAENFYHVKDHSTLQLINFARSKKLGCGLNCTST